MPYRFAHWYVLLLIPASMLGFSGYLGALTEEPPAKHLHALAATLWILLVAAQSASIQRGMRQLHRRVGFASVLLFPVYLCGFFLVFQSESQRIVDGDPFATVFGPGIGAITLISVVATAYMYYAALRDRRHVQMHARWMLVTLFLFSESVLGRILNGVPGLLVRSIEDVRSIYSAFHLAQLIAIVLALVLFAKQPKYGKPYLFVIGAMLAQSIALELFDDVQIWRGLFIDAASWPTTNLAAMGLVIGAIAALVGWKRGSSRIP
ncbi:MAG: hypothetical protein AAF270_05505 [Pseudomonadota bacterium]